MAFFLLMIVCHFIKKGKVGKQKERENALEIIDGWNGYPLSQIVPTDPTVSLTPLFRGPKSQDLKKQIEKFHKPIPLVLIYN